MVLFTYNISLFFYFGEDTPRCMVPLCIHGLTTVYRRLVLYTNALFTLDIDFLLFRCGREMNLLFYLSYSQRYVHR